MHLDVERKVRGVLMKLQRLFVSAIAIAMVCAAGSQAAFDLKITEIWAGQNGADITKDWIEVTNYGDMAWTSADDYPLYVDDDSALSTPVVRLVAGLTAISPGESVIILMEAVEADALAFNGQWGITGVSVGYASGSGLGLGDGGDTPHLFIGTATPSVYTLLDSASYDAQSTSETGAESWDVVLDGWSAVGNAAGAFESSALGGSNLPAIGSPGNVVPEPSSCVIAGLAALSLVALRKQLA